MALNEGNNFPVVTDFKLENVQPHETKIGYSVVGAKFKKVRECVFIRVDWFFAQSIESNDKVKVISYFEDPPAINKIGDHNFKRLVVNLSVDHITNQSYAVVVHKCHGNSLWNTVTEVYRTH